jgi:RNA polymerase sigma factor (sigma-70 family)
MFDGPSWIERRNELVVEHLPWAHDQARKVVRRLPTWFALEDLMAAAEIALIGLADKYVSYQSVPFRAFAIQRLRGACYDAIRRREYQERSHSELKDTHVDQSDSPERLAELAEMRSIWAQVYRLPERHGTVIRLMYGEQMTNQEVARQIHLSESRVSQMRGEALEMLRAMVKR